MPIPDSHQKSRLSAAYVSAVVTRAGHSTYLPEDLSDYGIDGHVSSVEYINGSYQNTGDLFEFQLKATVKCRFTDDKIAYTMEKKAYNKCVNWKGLIPIVLIVYDLPENIVDWVHQSTESLILRRCAYWCFMNVDDLVKSKKVVYIPQKNVFDANAVNYILSLAEKAKRVHINFNKL